MCCLSGPQRGGRDIATVWRHQRQTWGHLCGRLARCAVRTALVGGSACSLAARQSQQRPLDCMRAPELGWSCRAALTDPWLQCPPWRGHALGGGHNCEAPAIKYPGNWGDPHVDPEGRLGDAPCLVSCDITSWAPRGWVMHHDWCPVTSPAGCQVG